MSPFRAMGELQEEILLVLELFISTGLYNQLTMSGMEVRGQSILASVAGQVRMLHLLLSF